MKQFVKYLISLGVVLFSVLCTLHASAEESYNITLDKGGQLRNTNVETFDWTALNDCTGLERFYGSPVLSKFTYKDYHSHIPTIKEGWFYTKQKPENMDNFELIYIPQGFSAAYNNLLSIAVVDDIEL